MKDEAPVMVSLDSPASLRLRGKLLGNQAVMASPPLLTPQACACGQFEWKGFHPGFTEDSFNVLSERLFVCPERIQETMKGSELFGLLKYACLSRMRRRKEYFTRAASVA